MLKEKVAPLAQPSHFTTSLALTAMAICLANQARQLRLHTSVYFLEMAAQELLRQLRIEDCSMVEEIMLSFTEKWQALVLDEPALRFAGAKRPRSGMRQSPSSQSKCQK